MVKAQSVYIKPDNEENLWRVPKTYNQEAKFWTHLDC